MMRDRNSAPVTAVGDQVGGDGPATRSFPAARLGAPGDGEIIVVNAVRLAEQGIRKVGEPRIANVVLDQGYRPEIEVVVVFGDAVLGSPARSSAAWPLGFQQRPFLAAPLIGAKDHLGRSARSNTWSVMEDR